jgi:methionyl-tRNA formyltransferase
MKINILLDTPDSFLLDYVQDLISKLKKRGHKVYYFEDLQKIKQGDILIILAGRTILSKDYLLLNKNNIVIHPSKLPQGRGGGALVWKILEGERKIYLTLFEANEQIDKGDIYLQETIEFKGYELSDEIRNKQAKKTVEMALKYVDKQKYIKPQKQNGESSYYRKRSPKDSLLDIDKTIREQFNLLRVVDNKRYPAFFFFNGNKYIVKVFRENNYIDDEN